MPTTITEQNKIARERASARLTARHAPCRSVHLTTRAGGVAKSPPRKPEAGGLRWGRSSQCLCSASAWVGFSGAKHTNTKIRTTLPAKIIRARAHEPSHGLLSQRSHTGNKHGLHSGLAKQPRSQIRRRWPTIFRTEGFWLVVGLPRAKESTAHRPSTVSSAQCAPRLVFIQTKIRDRGRGTARLKKETRYRTGDYGHEATWWANRDARVRRSLEISNKPI